jgi:hypothetical protein
MVIAIEIGQFLPANELTGARTTIDIVLTEMVTFNEMAIGVAVMVYVPAVVYV